MIAEPIYTPRSKAFQQELQKEFLDPPNICRTIPMYVPREYSNIGDDRRYNGTQIVYSQSRKRRITVRQDPGIKAKPPTVNERVLGQSFIDICAVLEIDWTKYVKRPGKNWHHIHPAPVALDDEDDWLADPQEGRSTLLDIWQDAQDECDEYEMLYGWVDDQTTFKPRPPRIGDVVSPVRKSTDDLYLLYDEQREQRPSSTNPTEFTDDRTDGDPRWNAQSQEIWTSMVLKDRFGNPLREPFTGRIRETTVCYDLGDIMHQFNAPRRKPDRWITDPEHIAFLYNGFRKRVR